MSMDTATAAPAPAVRRFDDLPGPRALPVVGNLLQIKPERLHLQMEQWCRQYGPVFKLQLGARRAVVFGDHAVVQATLRDRPDRLSRVALGLGGLGVACLALPVLQALAAAASGAARTPLWGLLLPLGAALAWALGTVATKRWPPPGDRIVLTAWQLGIGAAVAAVAALAAGEHLPTVWPLRVQVALAWHVLIATAVAYVLWYRLLASATATVSSLTTLAVPVVGVLGAMALVGDRPSATDWVGFVLVLGGAALAMVRVTRPAA